MSLRPSDIWQDNAGFPSMEVIQRYVNGQMDKEETHRFERLMADSEVLSDAVEGLRLQPSTNELVVREINAAIDEHVSDRGKVVSMINYKNLAIAASFALLVTLGGVVLLQWVKNKTEAQDSVAVSNLSDSTKVDDPKLLAGSGVQSKGNDSLSSSSDALAMNSPQKIDLADKTRNESNSRKGMGVALDDQMSEPIAANYSTSATRAVEEMEEKKDEDMDSLGVPQANDPTHDLIAMELSKGAPSGDKLGEQKESQSKKVDKKAFAPAPSAIAAKSKLEAPKTRDAAETDALGIPISIKESIKKGNYSLALQELDKIILLNDQRKEEAQWLKSNCLIQMDKVEEAKEILKLLANSKGNFAAKASDVLKSLK